MPVLFPWRTMKIIFDLCSGSGSWSEPYAKAGYDVQRITLPMHDVRLLKVVEDVKKANVHGILAAPPCTCFCRSGARWERSEAEMIDALSVVDACLRLIIVCKPQWWCLENPIGMLVRYLGKPKMYFQPWEYGDPYTKRTCLWGDFKFPARKPVKPTEGSKIYKMPHSEKRSITPKGFARAFFKANP